MSTPGSGLVKRRYLLGALLVGAPVVGAIVCGANDAKGGLGQAQRDDLAVALYVVAAFVVVLLVFTEVTGRSSKNSMRKQYGYLEVLIGADGFASTSKAVVWLWTMIFASSLVLLTALVWVSPLGPDEAFGSTWDSYLLLLGGPFASAVLAKGITTSRASTQAGATTAAAVNGSTAPPTSKPELRDLLKANDGGGSLSDTQYVVFTTVAMTYFVGALVDNLHDYATPPAADTASMVGLPEIPSAILGLTSLAALTYVGAKAVETSGLRIVSVEPTSVSIGQTVRISLVNADTGLTQGTTSIVYSLDGATAETVAPTAPPTRVGVVTTVEAHVPASPGTYGVMVVTPGGASAPSQTVTVG